MSRNIVRSTLTLAIAVPLAIVLARGTAARPVAIPTPGVDVTVAAPGELQTAVLAGGCFWGIEAVYEHLQGVTDVVSGYSGGSADSADYDLVGTGRTGHAESVRITFDPSKISYGQILQVFFAVAHDPTQLNRQGPDEGPQYRSVIFYSGEEQALVARRFVEQLAREKAFSRPIVTEILPLHAFYLAEDYHQDYAKRNPNQPYIVIHDRPKVERLKKTFPTMYREARGER